MPSKENKLVSIKLNFILNAIRVLSMALITIFTMPYLNRILGVEKIGKVEYAFTIVNYFVLFSSLGIPMYGIREVSRSREDSKEVAKIVVELFSILFVTTVVSYLLIFGILIHLEFFNPYKKLIFILSGMVFLTNIGAEWYFQGVENQKFITIRTIAVRVLIFVLIFLLIKKPADYNIYALLLLILNCGANIINFIYIIKLVLKSRIQLKQLNFKRHLRPVLSIFIAAISVNIYLQLDCFLLGSISGDKSVGYYIIANKLIRYIIIFITLIGTVMLPRLSYLFNVDKEKYHNYLKKTFEIMMILAIPCTVYFFVFAKMIIEIMGGEFYEPSILTMRILSPLCIIVSFAYFYGFLILYPQGKEKIYTKATVISAVFSICVNIFAIKYFQQNGAAVIAVLAELLAILFMNYKIKKTEKNFHVFEKNFNKILGINIVILIIFYISNEFFIPENIISWVVSSFIFALAYIILLFVLKEKNIMESYQKILKKLNFPIQKNVN
jgi:O-antigen/teichoic acid export membrane protein